MNEALAVMPEAPEREVMSKILCGAVSTLFQPIINLRSGNIVGYEILSRGIPPLKEASRLFETAKILDCSRELERTSCLCALESIARLNPGPEYKFFLNFSVETLLDQPFYSFISPESLKKYGLTPDRVVIELSEKTPVPPGEDFEKTVSSIKAQGFSIAIDDLCSGFSCLRTILATSPSYLKIDMSVIREIHKHPDRLQMVKSLINFGAGINARIIAEGVETIEEYRALADHGLELAQGFLFAKPEDKLLDSVKYIPVFEEKKSILSVAGFFGQAGESERAGTIVRACHSLETGTITCAEADHFFSKHPDMDHFVLLDDKNVVGLVTRDHFYSMTAGAFGYSLNQNKPLEILAKKNFLAVRCDETIGSLYRTAMERPFEDVYDPVIVINEENRLLGSVTIRQLVLRAGEIETENALNNNPLSGLPGNRRIERWILEAQRSGREFVVVYADLSNFKEYNDRYGFIRGDEMIAFTTSIIKKALKRENGRIMLGHIGGDDFVFISDGMIEKDLLEDICRLFDEEKTPFFMESDLKSGFYYSKDRKGKNTRIPIVTINLAAISSKGFGMWKHPAELAQIAADLKHKVKQQSWAQGRSSYLFDRRHYGISRIGDLPPFAE
ncbi:MAG: EAL domain-containing protein [Thermovirga sp.]